MLLCISGHNYVQKNFFGGDIMQKGFTLAEVLITLGIIGIVAAMTLPALIQNYQEAVLTTRAKKSYSEISQAIQLFEAKNETPGDIRGLFEAKNNTSNNIQLAEEFAKYFASGTKVCKSKSDKNCSPYYYQIAYSAPWVDSTGTLIDWNSNVPKIILKDGTVIGIQQYQSCYWKQTANQTDEYGNVLKDENGNPLTSTWMSNICADIIMDTNGPERPNKFGADGFSIQVYASKIAPSTYSPLGGPSLRNLLINGKLIFTNYKVGEKLDF